MAGATGYNHHARVAGMGAEVFCHQGRGVAAGAYVDIVHSWKSDCTNAEVEYIGAGIHRRGDKLAHAFVQLWEA